MLTVADSGKNLLFELRGLFWVNRIICSKSFAKIVFFLFFFGNTNVIKKKIKLVSVVNLNVKLVGEDISSISLCLGTETPFQTP